MKLSAKILGTADQPPLLVACLESLVGETCLKFLQKAELTPAQTQSTRFAVSSAARHAIAMRPTTRGSLSKLTFKGEGAQAIEIFGDQRWVKNQ